MSLKGEVTIPLEHLRALLRDPDVQKNDRTTFYRLRMNGRIGYEWRQMGTRGFDGHCDLSFLLREIYERIDRGEPRLTDLRLDVIPET